MDHVYILNHRNDVCLSGFLDLVQGYGRRDDIPTNQVIWVIWFGWLHRPGQQGCAIVSRFTGSAACYLGRTIEETRAGSLVPMPVVNTRVPFPHAPVIELYRYTRLAPSQPVSVESLLGLRGVIKKGAP